MLNVNENEYRDYLAAMYDVVPLNFQWELMEVTDSEQMIPAERFPSHYFVNRGESYPKQVLRFHIPFIGEAELLKYKPSTYIMWSIDVMVEKDSIGIDFISFNDDSAPIQREFEGTRNKIKSQLNNVLTEVASFNMSLTANAQFAIAQRKTELLRQNNLLESLGVPVRTVAEVSPTFQVPVTKKEPLIKPVTSDAPFGPEWTLAEEEYQYILKICRDTGIVMERHPRIYFDKDEESLRDHFIMVLSPHFHSVTGETFNSQGKTDILIRHEGSNVFVAECKFWKGEKSLHDAVKQIIGYLTWRDSKAAILFFVNNQNIEMAVATAEAAARSDPAFVSFNFSKATGWLDFDFRLASDNPRHFRLSILLFHFPKKK
ncbi:MAG TPA: hypothetical protein VK612_13800 [Pyrinomonadaceae bacterium]|nr:hypothetical protein [Pyrinomonadaceae bacterium]